MKEFILQTKNLNLEFVDHTAQKISADSHLGTMLWSAGLAFDEFIRQETGLSSRCFTVGVEILTPQKMTALNFFHRNKKKVTDVLSFPLYLDLRKRKAKLKTELPKEVLLGDIVICSSVAKKQAKSFKISFEEELVHLLVHGLLHLLGYDHERSRTEAVLTSKKEEQLMELVYYYANRVPR